jgi:uncharacterized membrane protein (UPF0127 family)
MRPPAAVLRTALAGFLLALAAAACAGTPQEAEPLEGFPRAQVEIASRVGHYRFDVWVADTPARRAQGLMFVRRLAEDRGMLFVFERPQYASFWMQNTYVPLDLLFIAGDGRIVNIVERTVPLSTEPLLSTAPVDRVLELVAGSCERLGIAPGDRLVVVAARSAVTR